MSGYSKRFINIVDIHALTYKKIRTQNILLFLSKNIFEHFHFSFFVEIFKIQKLSKSNEVVQNETEIFQIFSLDLSILKFWKFQ